MGSVYKVIELVGSSSQGWEEAVKNALDTSSMVLTNMRVADIVELDSLLENGRIVKYRVKIRLSFKVEVEPETL